MQMKNDNGGVIVCLMIESQIRTWDVLDQRILDLV